LDRIFVSYSSKDRDVCAGIVSQLEKEGISCWVAPRDIPPGALWMESVIEAIDDCRAVLLLVTANSNSSSQVRRELERAVSRSKTIVPLILEEIKFSKWMQYSISVHHWHTAQKGELFRSMKDVVDALRQDECKVSSEPASPDMRESDLIAELFDTDDTDCLSVDYRITGDVPDQLLLKINEDITELADSSASKNGLTKKYTESKTAFRYAMDGDPSKSSVRAGVLLAAMSIDSGLQAIKDRISRRDLEMDFSVATFPDGDGSGNDPSGLTLDADTLEWLNENSVEYSGNYEEIAQYLRGQIGKTVSSLPECELVGRRKELAAVSALIEKQQFWHVDNPRGYATHLVAGIQGDAGIGKSAIVRHIGRELSKDDNLIPLTGHSSEGSAATGDLWHRVLENLMGMDQVQGVTADVIISFFRESYEVTLSEEDAVSLSLFLSAAELSSDSEQDNNTVAVEIAFRNLFDSIGNRHDPVFLLEDLHNCDETSLEILRFIIANTQRSRPYVFILTFRPLRNGRTVSFEMPSGYYQYEPIQLEGLDEPELRKMCDLLLSSAHPGTVCGADLIAYISKKTGGNPLFIRELLETLIQQKATETENGKLILSGNVSAAVSSENLRNLYDSRLLALTEEQRVLLKCLSVLGDQFSFGTVSAFLNAISFGMTSLEENLIGSMQGFLRQKTSAFRMVAAFSHSLLREHLYDQLNDEQLTRLHLAAAQVYENRTGSDPGTIALHYLKAGKKDDAVSWAMKKLQVLTGMQDRRGILEWSKQVLEWIRGEELYLRQEFELRSQRFRSLTSLGRKEGADSELEALQELVEGCEEKYLELEFRIMRFSYLVKNGNMTQARDSIGQLRQAVMDSGDESGLLRFYDTASKFHQLDYDPDMALQYIRKALDSDPSSSEEISLKKRMASILDGRGDHEKARQILFDILGSSRAMHAPILEMGVLSSIAKSYFDTGSWKEAEEYWDRGIKLARNTGSRRSEATMLNLMGHMYSRTRSIKDALEIQNKALSVMEEAGEKHGLAKVLTDLGLLYTRSGQKDKALKTFERALEIAREMKNKGAEAAVLADLSSLQKDLGDYDNAERNISEAISIWHETGYVKREAACIASRGSILERKGRLDDAIECFRKAIQLGESCDDKEGNAKRYGNLAVMMQLKHSWKDAEELYEKAIQMSSEMGNARMEALWTGYQGVLFDTTGKREKALENYLRSIEMLKEMGDRQYLFVMMGNYAGLMAKMGNDDEAFKVTKKKLTICREKGYRVDEAAALCDIAHHYHKTDEPAKAYRYFRDACLIASEKKMAVHMFRGIMVLYRVLKEKDFPVDECFPNHWGDPEKILRDSHEPEKEGKNI